MGENIINNDIPIKENSIDLEKVNEWRKWFLSQGYSLDSADTYYSFLKRFVRFTFKINQKEVDNFRNRYKSSVSAAALKSFFKFLHYKKDFPLEILGIRFEKSKQSKRLPKSISSNEVQSIINSMEGIKLKLITKVIYELGLRVSESLKLKWDSFNWGEWLQDKTKWGKVNLVNTKRKKFRVLPVKPDLMAELYNNHKNRNENGIPLGSLLFDFGILRYIKTKRNNQEEMHKYLIYAGNYYRFTLYKVSKDAIGKKISPHVLRHSKAQHLLDNGCPIETIKEMLGHEDIGTTQIYAKASPEKVKRDLQEYENKRG